MLKSTMALFLFVSLMLSVFTGCSKISPDNQIDVTPGSTLAYEEVETEIERLYPNLPEEKYNGDEIKILGTGKAYGSGYYQTTDVYVEAMNGEPLNDAIYERNRIIEEKYDIKISYSDSDDVQNTVFKAVSAGDYLCDIAFGSWGNMVQLGSKKFLTDISAINYIDLTKPWWDQNVLKSTAIAKKVYYATGELSTLDNSCTRMVYFNKKMIEDYSLELPYMLVNDNTWTLDNYIKMAKSVYKDVNGDGVSNEGDIFGTFHEDGYYDFLFIGCNMDYVRLDDEGRPVITFLDDRTFSLTDKIFDFLYDEKACIDINKFKDTKDFTNKYAYARSLFTQDQLLFTIGGPLVIEEFRNMESDFGIVPLPKYDSKQTKYCTYVDAGTNMIGVPATTADPGRTGVIMEAMAAESMYVITPVYNEILLKRKYSRDNESEAMLDLINESRIFSLKNVQDIGGVSGIMAKAYAKKAKPIMSDFEAVKDSTNEKLEKIFLEYTQ